MNGQSGPTQKHGFEGTTNESQLFINIVVTARIEYNSPNSLAECHYSGALQIELTTQKTKFAGKVPHLLT